jgi:hypothetical protein
MPTITAYQSLRDGSFNLSVDQEETVTWNPSNDIRKDGSDNRPVLCYRVDPTSNARNLRLNAQINGVNVGSNATFSGGMSRAYMEIVNNTSSINLGNNNITFEVTEPDNTNASGSLAISDVIIFYKRLPN